ncbi:MAG TPA: hypothetical protein VH394_24035, partial [Thermoanaerobaculia bacterium]|nr:hypothetical protein [Thermoanaerobaculia bacterium]
MPDKPEQNPTYRQVRWKRAVADWKSTRDWLVRTVVVSTVSGIAWITGGRMLTGVFSSLNLAVGVIIALLVAFLFFLWHWLRAPTKIWTENRGTIESLERQIQRLETSDLPAIIEDRLRMEIGSTSRHMPHERIKRAEELVSMFEKEVNSEDFR